MEYDDVWDIVWRSMYREDYETRGSDIYKDYDYTFVTGHVPVQRVWGWFGEVRNELKIYQKGNFIDIDGGCSIGYYPGVHNGAIFLRLDDMKAVGVEMTYV